MKNFVQRCGAFVGAIAALGVFVALPTQAAEGTWYSFTSNCNWSVHKAWDPGACITVYGPHGHANGAYFQSGVNFGLPYTQASCTVEVQAEYSGDQSPEDSVLTMNGKTVNVSDQGSGTHTLNLGTFTVNSGTNNIDVSGSSAVGWAESTWYHNIRVTSCVDTSPPVCGDGSVQTGEQCDDGNSSNTDACTNSCNNATCGDGYVRSGVEQCDDGNTSNTDSCTNSCNTAACGDGYVQSGETCDDGNTSSGDGCSSTCQTEAGATCGNSIVETGEECDDGNSSNTDACTNFCNDAECGDGYVRAGIEECDDGNTTNGDGCDSMCDTESGPTVGVCGTATQSAACVAPSLSLCSTGVASSVSENGSRWEWNCGTTACYTYKNCATKEIQPRGF